MFDSLFTPKNIGNLEVKNRFVVSAAVTRLANADGTCSEAFIRYQEDKAKGGWGLIIPEHFPVTNDAVTYARLPKLLNKKQIESSKELTRRVHAAGAKICAQLFHPGRSAKQELTGKEPMAPSAIINPPYPYIPREMTKEDIAEVVHAFGISAKGAVEAGFDAVEIHAAHGYLISQFLSGNTNKRSDEYGGSLRNRNRLLLEVIEEVRRVVGPEFPIILRISCQEYTPNGITIEESAYTARLAEEASVNAINCSAGTMETNYCIIPPSATPRALYVENAATLKKTVNIPVFAVGHINEPGLAEEIITSQRADFVVMLRSSLADPELPNKTREGKIDEISLCIGCLQGCLGQNRRLEPFTCMVRPMTGYAHEIEITPAEEPKKVMVIGGGVSGCEAAIYAAMRGHEVTVYEKSNNIGGRWIAASIPPGKAEYTSFINWQRTMMKKYGVKVQLNCEISLEQVKAIKPDVVILAIGADDFIPPIPGKDMDHVVKAEDILYSRVKPGKNVVVIGGGLIGAETADYLGRYVHNKVSIVEMLPEIMKDGEPSPTHFLLESFKAHKVDVYTNAVVSSIKEHSVVFQKDGEEIEIPADTVVMSTGLRANNNFYNSLLESGVTVVPVGDAAGAKNGLANIREGFMAGISI